MTELISIEAGLRLRPYSANENLDVALEWYQNPELVYLVDGVKEPYTLEKLRRMYHYLDQHGDLYWIEVADGQKWCAIGDVTLCPHDLPIVIGEVAFRGRGIGRKVIQALAQQARQSGRTRLEVADIYDYNIGSQKCFTACGFVESGQTAKGKSYQLDLSRIKDECIS